MGMAEKSCFFLKTSPGGLSIKNLFFPKVFKNFLKTFPKNRFSIFCSKNWFSLKKPWFSGILGHPAGGKFQCESNIVEPRYLPGRWGYEFGPYLKISEIYWIFRIFEKNSFSTIFRDPTTPAPPEPIFDPDVTFSHILDLGTWGHRIKIFFALRIRSIRKF